MLKVGVTGGIGSGKSTVCKIFELLGIPVYYADVEAKRLMGSNEALKEQIKADFGEHIYSKAGELQKDTLAEVVFSDPASLEKLNALVHPAVGSDFKQWVEPLSGHPYVIKEAALIFESGSNEFLDRVITVYSPKEMALARIIDRDKTSREAVESRMASQLDIEKKKELADHVIYNDNAHLLIPQVLQLDKELKGK